MAARFAFVDDDGTYRRRSSGSDSSNGGGGGGDVGRKLAGLTMTQVRAHIVRMAGRALAQAATVAVRYSEVRRQGFTDASKTSKKEEHAVLDYTTQQHRLCKAQGGGPIRFVFTATQGP